MKGVPDDPTHFQVPLPTVSLIKTQQWSCRNTFGSNLMNSRLWHSITRSGWNSRVSGEYAFMGDDSSNLAQDLHLAEYPRESAYHSFFLVNDTTDTIHTARQNGHWHACCLIPRIPPRPQWYEMWMIEQLIKAWHTVQFMDTHFWCSSLQLVHFTWRWNEKGHVGRRTRRGGLWKSIRSRRRQVLDWWHSWVQL